MNLALRSRRAGGIIVAFALQGCGDASFTAPPASGEGQDAGTVTVVDSSAANTPLEATVEDAARFEADATNSGEEDAARADADTADSGLRDADRADAGEHDGARADAEAADSGLRDADAVDSANGGNGDVALPANCLGTGAHSGVRWQDLYACYFGPTGIANCSLNSSCHTAGGQASAVWTCGSTSAQCYKGLVSMLVTDAGIADPMGTLLDFSLRKADGSGGDMPEEPQNAAFDTRDLTRIDSWITGGAKNN